MKGGSEGSVLWSIQTLFDAGSATVMTDRQLLEQFLAQQYPAAEAAFAALVAQHGPMVWNVCRSVLADSHAVEDAFQATFLILVRKAGSIRQRETLGPWLHGVARRVAVRAKANATRQRRQEGQPVEMKATSIPDLSRQEEIEALHAEIDRLPQKYRAAVVLCHLEGRTHAEAARVLKCPTGTVSIRVSRARELLRHRLTRRGLAFSTALSGMTLGHSSASAAIPYGLTESTIKAAIHLAAGKSMAAGAVPAAVMQLTDGVLRTMTLTKLTIAAAGVLAVGTVTMGIALLGMGQQSAQGKPRAAAAYAQADEEEQQQQARRKSVHNLRVISLAMHTFASASAETRLPAAAISKDGKPLLSWRVAILPHLGQQSLYDKFHLDEPWDSPHNKTLLNPMPDVYAPVTRTYEPKAFTYYQVLVGPGALFEGDQGPTIANIKAGSAKLMVVEAGSPVPWTKPDEVPFDKGKPLPKLGGQFQRGFHVAFVNGAVLALSRAIDPEVLRSLITSKGSEFVSPDMLWPNPPPRKND